MEILKNDCAGFLGLFFIVGVVTGWFGCLYIFTPQIEALHLEKVCEQKMKED